MVPPLIKVSIMHFSNCIIIMLMRMIMMLMPECP